MDALITTVLKRPYVFAFLIAYLILSIRRWGWKKSLLWLVSGYTIAWISEYASIHVNFPYGEYHYIYENLRGELLVGGVPFFDSLSYPFLIFAGYTTAEFILLPLLCKEGRGEVDLPHLTSPYKGGAIVILGALLTMLLDVIVDPIATMGDKWFLGKIHYYAHPGWYFGVPVTNFGGWFLVPLVVILLNVLLWPFFNLRSTIHDSRFTWLYPLFYIGIALFNIAITFYVGEWKLGISSSVILGIIAAFVTRAHLLSRSRQTTKS